VSSCGNGPLPAAPSAGIGRVFSCAASFQRSALRRGAPPEGRGARMLVARIEASQRASSRLTAHMPSRLRLSRSREHERRAQNLGSSIGPASRERIAEQMDPRTRPRGAKAQNNGTSPAAAGCSSSPIERVLP
jgi:hypothetical protein